MPMRWSPERIQELERAIDRGDRVRIFRQGGEHTVVPLDLQTEGSRERLSARFTSTGETRDLFLDELEDFDPLTP